MKVSSDFSSGHLDRHSPFAGLAIFDMFPGGLRRCGRRDSALAKQMFSSLAPPPKVCAPAGAARSHLKSVGQVAQPTNGRLLLWAFSDSGVFHHSSGHPEEGWGSTSPRVYFGILS